MSVRYPRGVCPACGERPYSLPNGIDIDGMTAFISCLNCDEAGRGRAE